jgi:hypothetical protein
MSGGILLLCLAIEICICSWPALWSVHAVGRRIAANLERHVVMLALGSRSFQRTSHDRPSSVSRDAAALRQRVAAKRRAGAVSRDGRSRVWRLGGHRRGHEQAWTREERCAIRRHELPNSQRSVRTTPRVVLRGESDRNVSTHPPSQSKHVRRVALSELDVNWWCLGA